eukprot:704618-Amphidinium_carterae.1
MPAPVAAPAITAPVSDSGGMMPYGAFVIGVPMMQGGVASGLPAGVLQQQQQPMAMPMPAA